MNVVRKSPAHIGSLLNSGKAEEALQLLTSIPESTGWIRNAMAVCLMRMGKPKKASDLLVELVYQKNSVVMRPDVSDGIKLNLVSAMLMAGNIEGAAGMLKEVKNETPMKTRVDHVFREWRKKQSIFSRIAMRLGIYPTCPVELDFPPGQIEGDGGDGVVQ